MSEKKKKSQEEAAKRDTKVKATTNLRDSQFPDVKLPGGVSTKATEYAELAEKGERWESPVFSIGSASESTDIPKPEDIRRKSHRAGGAAAGTGAGAAAAGAVGTNGTANGADGHAKTGADGYPSRGFSDEINQAFDSANGSSKNAADGAAAAVAGTPNAFNPQTA